jgi:hypothetical protein
MQHKVKIQDSLCPPFPSSSNTERTEHLSGPCTAPLIPKFFAGAKIFLACHSSLAARLVAALLRCVEALPATEDTKPIAHRSKIVAPREIPKNWFYRTERSGYGVVTDQLRLHNGLIGRKPRTVAGSPEGAIGSPEGSPTSSVPATLGTSRHPTGTLASCDTLRGAPSKRASPAQDGGNPRV